MLTSACGLLLTFRSMTLMPQCLWKIVRGRKCTAFGLRMLINSSMRIDADSVASPLTFSTCYTRLRLSDEEFAESQGRRKIWQADQVDIKRILSTQPSVVSLNLPPWRATRSGRRPLHDTTRRYVLDLSHSPIDGRYIPSHTSNLCVQLHVRDLDLAPWKDYRSYDEGSTRSRIFRTSGRDGTIQYDSKRNPSCDIAYSTECKDSMDASTWQPANAASRALPASTPSTS